MKLNIRYALAAALIACATHSSAQQQFGGSYFMEGSLFRHELNPAFEGQQSYFSFLPIGQLGVGVRGNFGFSDIFYNRGGKTVTYLHPDVSAQEVLGNLSSSNRLIYNVKTSIAGVGFRAFGGFNTIGINLRAYGGMRMPYELFDLTKNLQNKDYKVGSTSVQVQSFIELALGHSHRIDENWTVGGKFKLLFGAARLNAELNDLTLNMQSANTWTATAHATVEANMKGLIINNKLKEYSNKSLNTQVDPATGQTYGYQTIGDIDVKKPGLGGFGIAFDLGAEYDFRDAVPGLKLSFALLDLGFISWGHSHTIVNNGQDFTFDGFNKISVKESDEDRANSHNRKFKDQTEELADRLTDLYRLENKGDLGSSTHGIGATMNIGAEYALPVYDKVRFGLLSTTRIQGAYSWNEERLSVNYAPCNFFDMNVNAAVGSFGASFGWMLNLHPVGFNLFLGMDHTLGKVSKQFIPLSGKGDFHFGINFPLTRPKKRDAPKFEAQQELPQMDPALLPSNDAGTTTF